MYGTSVYSVVFAIGALVAAIVILAPMINMWRRLVSNTNKALEKGVEPPSWVGPAVTTVLTIGAYVLVVTLAWSTIVHTTATTSDYNSPAAIREQKNVQESKLPNDKELDTARTEQKQREQTKPHKEALDSFDESMKKEARKIKERN